MIGERWVTAFLVMGLFGLGLSATASYAAPADGPEQPSQNPLVVFVNITTERTKFIPDSFTVPPNASVRVRITQKDSFPHTFTVGAEKDVVLAQDLMPAQLDAYMDGNNLTDVPILGVVDTVVWANFTAPAERGRYEFVCRVGGHFQMGMLGFMTVAQEDIFVNMTTEGIRFDPSEFTVPPNALVYVRIEQREIAPHTFTVSAEKDFVLPDDWNTPQVDSYMEGNNLTDVAIPGGAGAIVWANFTAPSEPGRYEFVCRVPGHFRAGMVGFMVVSAGPPPDNRGLTIGLVPGIMIATVVFSLLFAAGYHVRAVRAHRRLKSR